jgi:hypothetical protein
VGLGQHEHRYTHWCRILSRDESSAVVSVPVNVEESAFEDASRLSVHDRRVDCEC